MEFGRSRIAAYVLVLVAVEQLGQLLHGLVALLVDLAELILVRRLPIEELLDLHASVFALLRLFLGFGSPSLL